MEPRMQLKDCCDLVYMQTLDTMVASVKTLQQTRRDVFRVKV